MDHNRDIEDLLKRSRENDKVDRERADHFRALVASEGWKLYSELLTGRVEALGGVLMQPLESVDGVLKEQWQKGAMYGCLFARDLPSVTIAAMDEAGKAERATSNEGDPAADSDEGEE